MKCINCSKLSFLFSNKRICYRCSSQLFDNLSVICPECSSKDIICEVCLKHIPSPISENKGCRSCRK